MVIPELTIRRVVAASLVVVGVAIAFWLLFRFHIVLLILFIAIVIGTAIRPPVTWLHRQGLPRPAGIIVVYLLLLAILMGFALLLAPPIAAQVSGLGQLLPEAYTRLRQALLSIPNLLILRLAFEMPQSLSAFPVQETTADEAMTAVAQLGQAVSVAASALFSVLATLVLAFYWTLDGERSTRAVLLLLPREKRQEAWELVKTVEEKVGAYVAGQALLSLIIGTVSLVVYLVLGLPYALALALFAGLMEAVPVVGPLLAAVPAILVAIPLGPERLVAVIIANIAIQQLENSFLVPRVMKRAVGVSPLVTLLALIAFSSLLGIVGALVAIPLAAVIQLLLDRYVTGPDAIQQEQPVGRDHLSVLRYETRDLVGDLRKQVRGKTEAAEADQDEVEDSLESIANELDTLLAQAVGGNGSGAGPR